MREAFSSWGGRVRRSRSTDSYDHDNPIFEEQPLSASVGAVPIARRQPDWGPSPVNADLNKIAFSMEMTDVHIHTGLSEQRAFTLQKYYFRRPDDTVFHFSDKEVYVLVNAVQMWCKGLPITTTKDESRQCIEFTLGCGNVIRMCGTERDILKLCETIRTIPSMRSPRLGLNRSSRSSGAK